MFMSIAFKQDTNIQNQPLCENLGSASHLIVRFHCFGIYLHTKWRHGDNRRRSRYGERQSPHYSEYVDNMLTICWQLNPHFAEWICWRHWTEYVWCWQYVCNWAALCRTEYVCKFAGSLCRRDAKAGLVLVNMWRWRWRGRDGHMDSWGRAYMAPLIIWSR